MKSNTDRPAAPPTVYRTLEFLLEKGLIHRLTSINAYIPVVIKRRPSGGFSDLYALSHC